MLEQANAGVISAFQDTDAGKDVEFKESYGASGDQARAVIAGQDADEVHLSLEPDVQKLVDEGLVADDWKDNDTKGICTTSVVVMVVRTGNPKNIQTWDDLIKPGVGIVTPNPASSGSAKWNLLAAYGSVLGDGGSEDDAAAYLKSFFANVAALPDSGRDATTAFTSGTGDVLLSYENEAILAKQSGDRLRLHHPGQHAAHREPVRPRRRRLGQGPGLHGLPEVRGGPEAVRRHRLPAARGRGRPERRRRQRPDRPFPDPETLLTIDDDFGGWADANTKYFDEAEGVITQIQAEAGE